MTHVSDHAYPCDLDPALRGRIVAALRASYDRFDPADFRPDTQGRYRTPAGGTISTLGWLYPAMHLMLSPRPDREMADRQTARAMILRAIRQGQYRRAGHPADGAWHWNLPAEPGTYPRDRNSAGFMGCALVRIWANDPLRLGEWPETDLAAFQDAVRASADAAIRHRVRIGYANPQILDFYLLWVAADLLGKPAYRQTGREQLDEFLRYGRTTDAFEEYLSPTYAAVNLSAAVSLAHYARGTDDEPATSELLERTWGHLTSSVHGPTRQVCGPHARAYHDTVQQNPDQIYGWLHMAAPEVFPRTGEDDSGYVRMLNELCAPGLYVPLGMPAPVAEAMRSRFEEPVETRVLTEWIGRCTWKPPYDLTRPDPAEPAPRFRLATRYRTADYCVGSINEQDGWLQRRSVLAYWLDADGEPTGVKWQVAVEVDDPEAYLGDWLFMMGVELVSAQSRHRVIGAYRTAPVAPVRPGDELTAPARPQAIGREDALSADDPVVWLVGTHWRQAIGRKDVRRRLKGLWIGITPIGAGQWRRLDEAGRQWTFAANGIEAVIETPTGASLLRRVNKAGGKEAVECLQLHAAGDIEWDWLAPPRIFLPFALAVQPAGQKREFGLNVAGDASDCQLRLGSLRMQWRDPAGCGQIQQRTWRGFVDDHEILPAGYSR